MGPPGEDGDKGEPGKPGEKGFKGGKGDAVSCARISGNIVPLRKVPYDIVRDLPDQTAILVCAEKLDLSAHPAREALLVTLVDEVVKEKTALKALADPPAPLETKVFPAPVAPKERKEISVRRVQSVLLALPENKELLAPRVFKVCPAPLDQKVLKDLKVKPEILAPLVLLDKMELTSVIVLFQ
jgi:hypothetical protein